MQTVTVTREIDAPAAAVREWMDDVEEFTRAAGFTEVAVEGTTVSIANAVGIIRIELELELVDRPGAALAYEQRDGIFEEMWTEYVVSDRDGGSTVTATTAFALDVAVVGPIFDATVVKRQRRLELERQLDYLVSRAG